MTVYVENSKESTEKFLEITLLYQGCRIEGMNRESAGEFQGIETTVYDNVVVET